MVSIEHASDRPVTLNLTADGFEDASFENLIFQKDTPLVLKIRKAEPVEGIIISAADNQPVTNAQIRILARQPGGHIYGKSSGKALATTDNTGRFVLDRLQKDSSYILSVKAEGYAYKNIYDITAGQKDIIISLDKDLIIHGQVLGPLDKLSKKDNQYVMPYSCCFSLGNSSDCDSSHSVPINTTQNGAFFEILNPWGTRITIGPKENITLNLDNKIPDLITIDLSDKLTESGKPYHKRKVILTFDTPKDMPAPTGTIYLSYLDSTVAQRTYKTLLLEIKDGRAEGMVDAPGEINYTLANTVGYWFAEKTIPVNDVNEPMLVQVPVVAAGMIYGQVFEEDGRPAGDAMVSFSVIKKVSLPENYEGNYGIMGKGSSNSSELESKYTLNPLPLGGTYCVIARRDFTYQVSKPIKLTSDNSIQQVDLVFPKGITLKGQIFTPDGTPAVQIPYTLSFTAKPNNSFGSGDKTTDDNGCFEIPQVNPDADGEYFFVINSKKDYRPLRMKIKDVSKPIQVTLEQGAVLTGRAIDQKTGWPIQGAAVRAFYYGSGDSESIYAESNTDADGRFQFSNMKAGREYTFYVDNCRCEIQYKATAGQTNELVISATPYEWSEAKIIQRSK